MSKYDPGLVIRVVELRCFYEEDNPVGKALDGLLKDLVNGTEGKRATAAARRVLKTLPEDSTAGKLIAGLVRLRK